MDNSNLANVRAEFYFEIAETKAEPVLTRPVSTSVADKKVLIVDDVADTGKSLKFVKEHIIENGAMKVRVTTVYYKPWSVVKPEYYEKENSYWIVFPWEIKRLFEKSSKNVRKMENP